MLFSSVKLPPKTSVYSSSVGNQTLGITYSSYYSVAVSPLDYDTVSEWLDGLGLSMCKSNFEEQGITTIDEVLTLSEEQLRKMDINLTGHVTKITRSIAVGNHNLGREPSARV